MFFVSLLLSVTDIKTKEIVLTLDLGKPSRHGMVVVVFKLREQQGHKLWCIFSLLKKLLGLHWDNRFQALHIQMRISHSSELVMYVFRDQILLKVIKYFFDAQTEIISKNQLLILSKS